MQKQMKRWNSRIILHRLGEGVLFTLLGLGIGLVFQSMFIDDRPWDKGITGGEELIPLQQTMGEGCGPTSLAMVARAWGIPIDEREAFMLVGVTSRGASMSDLVRVGRLIGLELVGMRLDLDELVKANKPVIAHMPPSHYVVIEHATRQQVTTINPASGRRRKAPSVEFARKWKGNCLVVIEKKEPTSFVTDFVTDWQLTGPYDINKSDPGQNHLSDIPRSNIQWRSIKPPDPSSRFRVSIDLIEQFGEREWATAYAQTLVYSPVDRSVVFHIGSDDGIQIWLNGVSIWRNLEVERPCQLDQDIVPVVISRGWNHLLFQIVQAKGEWEFVFRITDEQERALDDLRTRSDVQALPDGRGRARYETNARNATETQR